MFEDRHASRAPLGVTRDTVGVVARRGPCVHAAPKGAAWDLRPPLFQETTPSAWADARATANGMSLARHVSHPPARRRQPRRLKTIQDPILDSLQSEWDSGAARWNSPRISLAGWRGRHPGFRCIFPTPRVCIFSPGRRFAPPRL